METKEVKTPILKTRRDWYDQMTPEVQTAFWHNITPAQRGALNLNSDRVTLKKFVFEAFYWHQTKEGFEYWCKIANS